MYRWWLHGSGSEGQWLWGPCGLLLNIASEGGRAGEGLDGSSRSTTGCAAGAHRDSAFTTVGPILRAEDC